MRTLSQVFLISMNNFLKLRIFRLASLCVLMCASFLTSHAQAQTVYALEAGAAKDISTYLSPLYYKGSEYALSGSWTRPFHFCRDKAMMRFEADIRLSGMDNPSGTASMLGATARFNWGLAAYWNLSEHWRLSVGGAIDLYGGALWLTRNGNNPVTAMANAGVEATASASYKFKMGKLPVTIDDYVGVPTLSAFFCPGYGESYYEIYLGNHKDLAHFGWWGNAIGVNNLLSATLHLGKYSLLIGYRLNLRTFHANNLDTRVLGNSAVLGISF